MGSVRGHGQQVTPLILVIHPMTAVQVLRNAVAGPVGQRGISCSCMQADAGKRSPVGWSPAPTGRPNGRRDRSSPRSIPESSPLTDPSLTSSLPRNHHYPVLPARQSHAPASKPVGQPAMPTSFLRALRRSRYPESKGRLGLTTLHQPHPDRPVAADVIFVHGLNGGSRSTWSQGGDPALFWPGEWLPGEDAFQNVGIHTFGYPSDVGRKSVLGVRDFARSLLAAVADSPAINRPGVQVRSTPDKANLHA